MLTVILSSLPPAFMAGAGTVRTDPGRASALDRTANRQACPSIGDRLFGFVGIGTSGGWHLAGAVEEESNHLLAREV